MALAGGGDRVDVVFLCSDCVLAVERGDACCADDIEDGLAVGFFGGVRLELFIGRTGTLRMI